MTKPKDIWTVSRLKTFQICPFKEMLRYRDGIVPIRGRSALAFGTAIHKGLETRDIDEALAVLITDYPKDQEEADAQDVASVTVRALLESYFDLYPPFAEHKPEFQFELPMLTKTGCKSTVMSIAGKLDDLVKINGQWWIVEYKTASRLDSSYFDRLYVDSQITMYMSAMTRMGYDPVGVIYRVIRKPTLRRGQKETLEEFLERLRNDIRNRPDFYFMERKLYRSKGDLKEFHNTLYQEARLEKNMAKRGEAFKHTTSCSMYGACEYLPICMGEEGAMEALYEHREPHEELQTAKEEFE